MDKIQDIEKSIKTFSDFDKEKRILRLHINNRLNQNHSRVLSSFEDVKTIYVRLNEDLSLWIQNERDMRQMSRFKETKSGPYPEEVQIEMRKSDLLSKRVHVDFKALYLFSVILLDIYVKFLYFINPEDKLKSGTVETFLNSLKTEGLSTFYKVLASNLANLSEDICGKLTFYRSKKIEHSQFVNEDIWFMNDMQGNVTISHVDRDNAEQITAIGPKDLLNIVSNFFFLTSSYFIKQQKDIRS